MTSRIAIKSIQLNRVEGVIASESVTTFRGANNALRDWSLTAPVADKGCDKVDFFITFENGEQYKGIYGLQHLNVKTPDLAEHINNSMLFKAGLRHPDNLNEEQHVALMKRIDPVGDLPQKTLAYMNKYDIGTPAPETKVIFSRSEYLKSSGWAGFWSNEEGWVAIENATLFTEEPVSPPTIGMPENDVALIAHPGVDKFFELDVTKSGDEHTTTFKTWAKNRLQADLNAAEEHHNCVINTPRYRLVSLESTSYWAEDVQQKAGRIFDVYIYDANKAVHMCELTPSYELHPLYSEAQQSSDEVHDILMTNQDSDVMYVHCRQIDKLPENRFHETENSKPHDEDVSPEQDFEENVEYYKANCCIGVPNDVPFTEEPESAPTLS